MRKATEEMEGEEGDGGGDEEAKDVKEAVEARKKK